MSKYMNKIKENLPEMQHLGRKYFREILTIVAIVVAGFSSWEEFFINGLGMSVLFIMLGLIVGIIFSSHVHNLIHKFYDMTSRKSFSAELAVEGAKIVLAFFFSFIYFLGVGLLASSAYMYFSRQARENKKHDRAA